MRKKSPKSDKRQSHEIRKQERSHWGSAIHQLIEEVIARLNKVCAHMEPESQYAYKCLSTHHQQTEVEKAACDGDYDWNDEEPGAECRRDYGYP